MIEQSCETCEYEGEGWCGYFDGPIDMWINGCEKYTRKTNLSWLVHKLEETLDELRQVCVDDMKGLANEIVRMRKRLDECEKKIEVIQNHGCRCGKSKDDD